MDKLEEKTKIFKVLSDTNRLRIIQLLKKQNYCVNAIAHFLNITPAAVSQHLRILRSAGIVKADKQGYYVHYQLDREKLAEWKEQIQNLLELDV